MFKKNGSIEQISICAEKYAQVLGCIFEGIEGNEVIVNV